MKVLNENVLIKKLPPNDKTAGGIILIEMAQEEQFIGEVITTGKGVLLSNGEYEPLMVKQGDKVIYSKFAGKKIVVEGVDYYVFKESELIAIINN
jgi:chaperonin GroES